MATTKLSLLEQYKEIKETHPDTILLFRVGDFYETFSDDAITVSEILGITLTRSPKGKSEATELAGFPYHALDTYLTKLANAGKRVTVLEQIGKQEEQKVKAIETATSTSNPTLKPKKLVKEINCILSFEQIRELGEPDACFRLKLPKELKTLGKYMYKNERYPLFSYLWIVPERNVAVHTDTQFMNIIDIECSGYWPEDESEEQNQPFACPIDPKALSLLAGKTVDVAVWLDDKGGIKLAGCEAEGIRTQTHEIDRVPRAQFARFIDVRTTPVFRLSTENMKKLQEWIKDNLSPVTTKKLKDSDKDHKGLRMIAADSKLTLMKSDIVPLELENVEVFKNTDLTCDEILFQLCINNDNNFVDAMQASGMGSILWFRYPRCRSLLVTLPVTEEDSCKDSSSSN